MADFEEIKIAITLDDGSVKQGFARVLKEGENAGKGLSASFTSLTGVIGGLAAAYFSLSAVKNIFSSAVSAAQDQEAAINRLNQSLALAGRDRKSVV